MKVILNFVYVFFSLISFTQSGQILYEAEVRIGNLNDIRKIINRLFLMT